jgi:hypothetical protein
MKPVWPKRQRQQQILQERESLLGKPHRSSPPRSILHTPIVYNLFIDSFNCYRCCLTVARQCHTVAIGARRDRAGSCPGTGKCDTLVSLKCWQFCLVCGTHWHALQQSTPCII